jgi:micrococcal nuclease
MVEHGYAWAYDGGTKKKNLQELLEIRTLRGTINGV